MKNLCLLVFSAILYLFYNSLSETPKPLYSLQVPTDAGVDTLIPVSLQSKDNPILQQLLPTLLNSAILGEFAHTHPVLYVFLIVLGINIIYLSVLNFKLCRDSIAVFLYTVY